MAGRFVSLSALPVRATSFDVLVCAAYKWLMAPRGAAFCYLAPELRERMRPLQAGWYAGQNVHESYYGPPLRLAGSARRFDTSPAWFGFVGAAHHGGGCGPCGGSAVRLMTRPAVSP